MVETVRSILARKGANVWSVSPQASVYDAIALMAEKGVGALVVLQEGKLVGILSERDYARKVMLKGKASRETPVEEIMSSPVITVTPTDTVDECMRVVTVNKIRHLPVLDSGKLVGVVSIGDLVREIVQLQAETINQLSSYIAGKYPA